MEAESESGRRKRTKAYAALAALVGLALLAATLDAWRDGAEADARAQTETLETHAQRLGADVAALEGPAVPRDLLDERVRATLGYRHAREVALEPAGE